ncbi:acetate/propionate family kinase [Aestuariivita sp.]|jgi:acetate kinase|uniref:acetate/propionate family kinase n=1 Tax=Aestuariivita sp. TaxID=1872407 RepID=UPI002170F6D0|nr:acetate/propionate family kinase [Aestuariivita sp.]MCE8008372.1 acetate/propionate family kinase [Aestuariivita sp.]
MSAILTLNAGSSSIKFGVYVAGADPQALIDGQVENLGEAALLEIGETEIAIGAADHAVAVAAILRAIEPVLDGRRVEVVGHRVVHGGTGFSAPVHLDDAAIAELEGLIPLAPLHQPHNLAGVHAARAAFPEAIQVACFDTAFHHNRPFVADAFALPRRFYEAGVRRYGFHGLSYDYIAGVLRRDYPDLHKGRVVVAHLGNGASMCAMEGGRSVGSSMGFSALDGLPMGTRCGQIDPGVLLYLMDQGMDIEEMTTLLYKESGLKGLSGLTHDMRTLLASDDPHAVQALDYYTFRIRRELGAMAAVLGGVDAMVFTGGVGENAAPIRTRVLEKTGFLGLAVDAEANARNAREIGAGPTPVLVIGTDEERVIARVANSWLRRHRM